MNTNTNSQSIATATGSRYYQIRIYESDPCKLLERCDRCTGEVMMEMEDGSLASLKSDVFLRLAFRTMNLPGSGLKLYLTDAGDLSIFLQYLSGVWSVTH